MIKIFMLYLSIPSRINFLQLGRHSRFGEQRFHRQFERGFDFFGFNKVLSMPWIGSRTAVAFDPSFIHKPGKKTPGIGYFWSGCEGRARRGIEILGLSVIDADTRLSFHLDAIQTPSTNCLQDNDLSLIDWYAGVIKKHIELILSITRYIVADAVRFLAKNCKKHFVDTDHVFTFGDSAGGQIAMMLLLTSPESLPGSSELARYSYKIIAGVSWDGHSDFEKVDLFVTSDTTKIPDRFGPRIVKTDTNPKEKLALYREMSPINYLRTDSPPLLMIQGNKDVTIPVKHAYYMKEKADAIHAPVEIFIINNAGHNFRQVDAPIEPSAELIVKRTVSFICDHLNKN